MFRIIIAGVSVIVMFSVSLPAATFTVAKNGSAQYNTIQAAVDAASRNDIVQIVDAGTYYEMVTIDSTKSGLRLYGGSDGAFSRPVISFRDTVHVHPQNAEEAHDPELFDFYMNGALRIVGAQDIRVEGICIDGGEPYVFGGDEVWEAADQKWPLQHGNAALCITVSGNTIIRHCTFRNAFFGIYVFDNNPNGIYAIPTAYDGALTEASERQPLSVGNHSIEYNRIHDNSFGIMFENGVDMGSTVRYNLFYENHHKSNVFAQYVEEFTSEGLNLPGGAFYFKNTLLSPLAIYNNTFWHNTAVFVGGWKAGGQHLVFNNIYGAPNKYYSEAPSFPTHLDMMKSFSNRMHHCVIAAQQQAPTSNYIAITNDFSQPSAEGVITTKPFPVSAEIRYLETPFISTDPADPDFLVPDWTDQRVKSYIVDQGWEYSGVKDPDGTRSDIGAICLGGGENSPVSLIRPVAPVIMVDNNVELSFLAGPSPYENDGVMTGAKATLFGVVQDLETSDVFGSAYRPIAPNNIQKVALESCPVNSGVTNRISFPLTQSLGEYAFFEMVVEGRNASGNLYTTAVGFIPYRKNAWFFRVELLDKNGARVVQARVGDSLALKIRVVRTMAGDTFSSPVPEIRFGTLSGSALTTLSGEPIEHIGSGFRDSVVVDCRLAAVPRSGHENIIVWGACKENEYASDVWYNGCSGDFEVYDKLSPVVHGRQKISDVSGRYRIEFFDCSGRMVQRIEEVDYQHVMKMSCLRVGRSAGITICRLTNLATGKVLVEKSVNIGSEGYRMSSDMR